MCLTQKSHLFSTNRPSGQIWSTIRHVHLFVCLPVPLWNSYFRRLSNFGQRSQPTCWSVIIQFFINLVQFTFLDFLSTKLIKNWSKSTTYSKFFSFCKVFIPLEVYAWHVTTPLSVCPYFCRSVHTSHQKHFLPVLVVLSASVERFGVSHMQIFLSKDKK